MLTGHPKCVNKGQAEPQEPWSADLIADAFKPLPLIVFLESLLSFSIL